MKWELTTEKNLKADAPKGGWWEYGQNNSGGLFDPDGGYETWIWAQSASQANNIAEQNGIYFDGCEKDHDCPCCGDRWYAAQGDKPDKEDMSVENLVEHLTENGSKSALSWAANWGLGIRIIDKDGTVHWLRAEKPNGFLKI